VCPGNLARQIHVVIGDVRLWVLGPVLELHFQTTTELVEIDLRPIDAQRRRCEEFRTGGNRGNRVLLSSSPFSLFALVELRDSSVRVRKDKAMHTIAQLHFMKVDE